MTKISVEAVTKALARFEGLPNTLETREEILKAVTEAIVAQIRYHEALPQSVWTSKAQCRWCGRSFSAYVEQEQMELRFGHCLGQ